MKIIEDKLETLCLKHLFTTNLFRMTSCACHTHQVNDVI